ncbi:hypothetical protein F5Y19DRAFT_180003 [Xylariaceae sp. FL1651]|nr:hypothetical protein F5Y19DRAFT_180003 [Xylariaceae sp. FL1651]
MVFIPPNTNTPRLTAYLLAELPDAELQSFKRAFEFGTCAPFCPMLELVLQRAPRDYVDKPHGYVRLREDEAGRTAPFVLLDPGSAPAEGVAAVWYVDRFAGADEVADGLAEATSVAWRIPVKTECLAVMYVNYAIGNMSIREDLGNLGVRFPVREEYAVERAHDCGGLDMERQYRSCSAYPVAYPGEFEESTDEEFRRRFLPVPAKVARFKEGVAESVGLVNGDWSIPSPARSRRMPDGSLKEFPEGSVVLQTKYDPDFDWPEYKWPEGSL